MSSVRPKISAETPTHLTAWESATGAVVYRSRTGWTRDISDAVVLKGEAAEIALAEAAKDQVRVTDPYLMEAQPTGGAAGRETLRETIRAVGPTTHPEFARDRRAEEAA